MVVGGNKAKATVELALDDKDFKKGTQDATAGLESQMGGLATKIGGVVVALGLVAAAKGAITTLTSLAKKAIDVADSFEVMEKQLTTLTKSAPKAQAFFQGILEFAKETPFQVRELAGALNMLYPVFGEKAPAMLKTIGETASGTGKSIDMVAQAFMQLASGNFGVQILRQLFVTKEALGDIFGPTGELVVTTEEAMDRLTGLLQDRFGGMMVGMMDTVQGKVSNLGDVLDSLSNSVGGELTPITKEFYDILIEVVKELEEAGTLKDAVSGLAEAIEENKDILGDIIGLLPDLIDSFAGILTIFTELVRLGGEMNQGWKELWGPGGQTLIKDTADALGWIITRLVRVAQLYVAIQMGNFKGAAAMMKDWRADEVIGPAGAAKPKTGLGIHGRIKAELDAGRTPEEVADYARSMGASEAQIQAGFEEYRRRTEKPGRPGKPAKAKKREPDPWAVSELGRLEAYETAADRRDEFTTRGYERDEELEAQQKERHEKNLEQVQELAEQYRQYGDPSSYIIAGLKSGDMKAAMLDFAVNLGTRVSEELLSALFMQGLLAILGGGLTPLGMGPVFGRGGVRRAARGLVTELPARPGGYMIPWGNEWINAAEAGQNEIAAFLPKGRRGAEVLINQVMPMFNIKPQVDVGVETRPVNNITLNVTNADRHHIRAYNAAEAGKVNKAVNVRE